MPLCVNNKVRSNYCKGKGKFITIVSVNLSLFLIKYHTIKTYWGVDL